MLWIEKVHRAVAAILECGQITVASYDGIMVNAYTYEPWDSQKEWFDKAVDFIEMATDHDYGGDMSINLFTPDGLHSYPEVKDTNG